MSAAKDTGEDFVPVADIEVEAVRPEKGGFVLQGRGADRADYRIEMNLEIPVDRQTQAVLGEILTQSEFKLRRRAPASMRRPAVRSRNRKART